MRKINIFLTIVLVLSITACAVYAYTKKIPENKIIKDTLNSSYKVYYDNSEVKTKEYKLKDGSIVTLNYKETRLDKRNNHIEVKYIDSNGCSYGFDKDNGKLVNATFITKEIGKSRANLDESKKAGFEEIKTAAENTIKKFVNLNDYSFDKYSHNSNYYSFIWCKYINGVATADYVFIGVDEYGNALSVNMPREGIYKQNESELAHSAKNSIPEEKAIKIAQQKLNETYKDVAFNAEYKVDSTKLYVNKEKRLVWICNFEIQYKTSNNQGISVLEGFIIDANSGEILQHIK